MLYNLFEYARSMDILIIGLLAALITSIGFTPQLIKGFKTKKLDDVSYYMPIVLTLGMSLWLIYGILRIDVAIIVANVFAISCNMLLIIMKFYYSHKITSL